VKRDGDRNLGSAPRNLELCIVGAGMSGLLMGIRLKQAGIESFRIVEKAASLGGPGVRTPIPASPATCPRSTKGTVWATGCNSRVLDKDGVPKPWPWTASRFHKEMRKPNLADFELHTAC